MTTAEMLESVLEANRQVLQRARELNSRAGREVFPLVPTHELNALVLRCLNGARCASEIQNVECLRLPQLDGTTEAQVLAKCPDTIMVLGKERTVEYRARMSPRITIESSEVRENTWKDLPDECVCLPDGRPVELNFTWDYWTSFSGFDPSQLKAQLKEKVNEDQWAKFTKKPAIALPSSADPEARVAPVLKVQYGTCVVTGEPLMAYGATEQNYGTRYEGAPEFFAKWVRDEAEAQSLCAASERHLKFLQAQVVVESEKKVKLKGATELRARLQDLHRMYGSDPSMPQNLRDRLLSISYDSGFEWDLDRWEKKAQSLVAQVDLAAKKIEADREAERLALESAKAREVEIYGVTGFLLDAARALAERALENHRRDAEEIFMEELTAPYGRERRQDAIRSRLGNGGATSNFYNLSRASDVDAVLEAAIRIVNERRVAAAQKAATSNKPQTPADPKKFDMGQLFGGVAKEAKKRGGKKSPKSR